MGIAHSLAMQLIQSIILGIVQGLTEFIPVSSSAHLVIVPWLFGWNDPIFLSLGFDVALHMGTLVALIVFFRKDWVRLIGAWFQSIGHFEIGDDPDRKDGVVPARRLHSRGIAGILFEGKIERLFHPEGQPILASSMIAMAVILALLGLLLLLADRFAKHDRAIASMRWKDAILIGLSQALAIFPGVSRSGATITAGLALGLERESAARFSFLLSRPSSRGRGQRASTISLAATRQRAEPSLRRAELRRAELRRAPSRLDCPSLSWSASSSPP